MFDSTLAPALCCLTLRHVATVLLSVQKGKERQLEHSLSASLYMYVACTEITSQIARQPKCLQEHAVSSF